MFNPIAKLIYVISLTPKANKKYSALKSVILKSQLTNPITIFIKIKYINKNFFQKIMNIQTLIDLDRISWLQFQPNLSEFSLSKKSSEFTQSNFSIPKINFKYNIKQ